TRAYSVRNSRRSSRRRERFLVKLANHRQETQRVTLGTASVCSQAFWMKGLTKMTAAPVDFAHRVTGDAVRHRRRGEALEGAIYDAVVDELAEIGYAAFTIESVAARAHTGKASIYRRWPTKQDLVVAAFCAKAGEAFDLVGSATSAATTTRDALVH